MARNGLEKASLIYPGQVLLISNTASAPVKSQATQTPIEVEPEPAPALAQTPVEQTVSQPSVPASSKVDLLAVYP